MLAHGILASVAGEEQFQLLQVALHQPVGVSLVAYLHEVKTYRLLHCLHDGHGGDVLHARLEESLCLLLDFREIGNLGDATVFIGFKVDGGAYHALGSALRYHGHHLVPEVVTHRIGLYVQEGVAHLIALAGGIVYHEAHLGGYAERLHRVLAVHLPLILIYPVFAGVALAEVGHHIHHRVFASCVHFQRVGVVR